jgi:L-arabinose 1-dehydrogenase [NAD(P)+]
MDIAVTGAAGSVGGATLDALADTDHAVTAITHRDCEASDVALDVTDREALADALAGHDAVVHLAADPSPAAAWEDVLDANVDGTHSLYEAAVAGGLSRVVFASSNHVQQAYNVADLGEEGATESATSDARAVHPEEPARPDSYYAVSKVAGEALGSYYADRHGLTVVNARIGWLLERAELREKAGLAADRARYARAMWLSPRDWTDFVCRALTRSLPRNPLTVNVTSENAERYLSLVETRRALGYEPRDDSSAVR